ncbi:MAG: hypothetical protein Q7I99_05765 [Acholeplasmataceae bacterium]|nr:hypothetical protein [Acholeplasmataceae bacterium]
MSKNKIYSLVIFLQLVFFIYFLIMQSLSGIPSLNFFGRLLGPTLLEAIIPTFFRYSWGSGYVMISAIFPLLFIGIYAIANRLNSSFLKASPILYFWFYSFNVASFILFAYLAGAYLGFVLIILYCGLLYLCTRSIKKAQINNQDQNRILAKIYINYFFINLLYIPMQLGIFALFYVGN